MVGYYTRKQIAELFGVGARHVGNLVEVGLIPKPIQAGHGHKCWWPKKQIDKLIKDAA